MNWLPLFLFLQTFSLIIFLTFLFLPSKVKGWTNDSIGQQLFGQTFHDKRKFDQQCISGQEFEFARSQHGRQVQPPLPVCPSLLPPITPYIEYPVPADCGSVPIGTRCSVGCFRGYELIGSCSRLCCGTGTWSGYDAFCINRAIQCPDLSPQFPPGSPNQCDQPMNPSFPQLNSGNEEIEPAEQWSTPEPRVSRHQKSYYNRRHPASIASRQARQTMGQRAIPLDSQSCIPFAGAVCKFCCPSGSTPSGPLTIYCQESGTWNLPIPTCGGGTTQTTPPFTFPTSGPGTQQPPGTRPPGGCFDLNPPQFGTVRGSCVNAGIGQSCIFMCDQGYTLAGTSTVTCGPAGWSSAAPTCVPIYCPNITDASIMNGRTNGQCAPGMGDKICSIVCNAGFRPSSVTQLPPVIGPDGNPILPPPVVGPVVPIQNTANLLCLNNMQYNTTVPTCVPITCPSLPSTIPNGFVQQGSNCAPGQALTLCSYQCAPGYQITGSSSSLLCQLDGRWTGSVPRCTRILCPSITPNANRTATGQCDPGYAFQTCKVKCNIGFQPTYEVNLNCTVFGNYSRGIGLDGFGGNGQFDDLGVPKCIPLPCRPTLTPPPNGILFEGDFEIPPDPAVTPPGSVQVISSYCINAVAGDFCAVKCNPGYFVTAGKPFMVLQCDPFGFWPLMGPIECLPIQCPPRIAPLHSTASIGCGSGFYGEMCTIKCDDGYTPEMTASTCTEMGTWDAEIVPCMRKTCKNPNGTLPIPNGIMTGPGCTSAGRQGFVGECCVYSCDIGYALTGTALINCINVPGSDDGIFEPDVFKENGNSPQCVPVLCSPVPPMFPNGMFDVAQSSCSTRVTSICNAKCNDGFVIVYANFQLGASREIVCSSNAVWRMPSVAPLAPRPIDPNGFRCVEVAKPQCNPIIIPDNGAGTDTCQVFLLDTECTISCNFGFELVGNPTFKCMNNVNNQPTVVPSQISPPVCRPVTCPGLSAPSNGYVMGTCSPGKPGMSCMFGCNTGFMLSPPGTPPILECLGDGSYSAEVPYCARSTCPPLAAPPGGYLVGVCTPGQGGESCGIVCPPGFRPNGPTNVICGLNGAWQGEIPTCVAADGSGVTLPGGTLSPGEGGTTPTPGGPGGPSGPGGTPGTPGVPGGPGGPSRPGIPGRPGTGPGTGCRPRRRCCPRLFIPRTVIIIGCKNLPRFGLPEVGTICTLRCNNNIQSGPRDGASSYSFADSITGAVISDARSRRIKPPTEDPKQEFNFFGFKSRPVILTVTCMRSQKWSGGDPMAMTCGSSSPQITAGDSQPDSNYPIGPPISPPVDQSYGGSKDKKKNDRVKNSGVHNRPHDGYRPQRPVNHHRPNSGHHTPNSHNKYNRRGTSPNDGRPWVNVRTNQSINFNVYSWITLN